MTNIMTMDDVLRVRAKVLAKEEVTVEELQRCVEFLRTARTAHPVAKESKAKPTPLKSELIKLFDNVEGPKNG